MFERITTKRSLGTQEITRFRITDQTNYSIRLQEKKEKNDIASIHAINLNFPNAKTSLNIFLIADIRDLFNALKVLPSTSDLLSYF